MHEKYTFTSNILRRLMLPKHLSVVFTAPEPGCPIRGRENGENSPYHRGGSRWLDKHRRSHLAQRAYLGPIVATVPFWGDSLFPRPLICVALGGDDRQNRVLHSSAPSSLIISSLIALTLSAPMCLSSPLLSSHLCCLYFVSL